MRFYFSTVILICCFSAVVAASGQSELRSTPNQAFKPGEKLTFRIHYGFVDAGTAELYVASEKKNIGPRTCYHVIGTGKSVGAFDWFFKVRDRYESYIDADAMVPWLFIRDISEGGYKKKQRVIFNQYVDSARSEKKSISVPDNTQDLISAFYFARTIDLSNAKPGDVFPINGYLDDEVIPLNIKFIGRQTLHTDFGKFRCVVFRPMLQEGRVFKESEDMTVWISDDLNRIPVRVQSNILVGSIKMDLTGYENLLHAPAVERNK
ncbi:MAG: hypothetical protein RIQ47_690 [Bacteroidota bacterium]|jgi:hypothetical protein